MANSFKEYPGDDSTTLWSVTFPFNSRDHVTVFDTADGAAITFTWVSDSQIQITPAVSSSVIFRIKRTTPSVSRVVDFQDATNLNEATLDLDSNQLFYIVQEVLDASGLNVTVPISGVSTELPVPEALKHLRWNSSANALENIVISSLGVGISEPNLTATTDPTTTDDESSGYTAWSLWFNSVAKTLWACSDPTTSAAVWIQVGEAAQAGTGGDPSRAQSIHNSMGYT